MAAVKSLVHRTDSNRLSWTLFNFNNKMPVIENSDKLQNSAARIQTLNSSPRIKPLKGDISCRRKGVSIEKIPFGNIPINPQTKQSIAVKPVYPLKLPLHTDVLETTPDVYRLDLGNEDPATARTLSNMKVLLLNDQIGIRKKSDPALKKDSSQDFQQRFTKQYNHFRRTQNTHMMHYLGKFKSLAEINNRANSLYFRIDESQGRSRGHLTARDYASSERKETNPPFMRKQSPDVSIGRKGVSDANTDYFSQQKSSSVTRLNVKAETQVYPTKRVVTEELHRRQTFSSPTNFWTPIQETPSLSPEFDISKQKELKDFNLDSEGIRSPLPKNETGQLVKFVINEESPSRMSRISPQIKKVSSKKEPSPQGREASSSPRLQTLPHPILNIEFRQDEFEDPKTRKGSRQPSEVRAYPESPEPKTPEINHKVIVVRKKPVKIKTQAPRAFVQRNVNRSKSLGGAMPKRVIGANSNGDPQDSSKLDKSVRKGTFRLVKGKRVEEISELDVEGWEHSRNTHNNTVEKKSLNMG